MPKPKRAPRPTKTATLGLAHMIALGDLRWKRRVRDALDAMGSIPAAAQKLGVSRSTLYTIIKAHPDLLASMELRGPGNPTFGPAYGNGKNIPKK